MSRFATCLIVLFVCLSPCLPICRAAARLDEIKEYFELRDTLNLVNLEMKRALAPEGRSELLEGPDAELDLTRLVMFLEQRVKDFSQQQTAFKYHYNRNLKKQFLDTKYLYSNLLLRIRAATLKKTKNNRLKTAAAKQGTAEHQLKARPYFKPIEVRTLLSPKLLTEYQRLTLKNKADKAPAIKQPDRAKLQAKKAESLSPVRNKLPVAEPESIADAKPQSLTVIKSVPQAEVKQTTQKSEIKTQQPQPVASNPPADRKPEEKQPAVPAVDFAAVNTASAPKPKSQKMVASSPVSTEVIPANETKKAVAVAAPTLKTANVTKIASATPKIAMRLRPLAVMIENHRKARPQSGLHQAEIVYEIPVEGGITRFMAMFFHVPGILGPVRSCREYFVDRALEVDALYVHCGGSPMGYAYIAKSNINSIDEIKYGKPFYRDKSRKAPHNLYTKGKRLFDYMSSRVPMKLASGTRPLNIGAQPTKGRQPGQKIFIRYHGNYNVTYKYNKGSYDRYMNGKKHVDRESKKLISPKTVIVQTASMKTVDKVGRQEISFIGSGKAVIFHAGTMLEATWKKASPQAVTRYYAENGEEIALSSQKPVWIQVVSPNLKIAFNDTGKKTAKKR
jgi:hypothetical protein